MYTAEQILLPLQRLQLIHDQAAHFDMLSFDLHKRLKHMVLHFFKYAGRIEAAREAEDHVVLAGTLLDAFVICMATANALNLSLGEHMKATAISNDIDSLAAALQEERRHADIYSTAIRKLVLVGGKMAKAVESQDHLERGDCRSAMETLLPELTGAMLGLLGETTKNIESKLRTRFSNIENKSIFARLANTSAT